MTATNSRILRVEAENIPNELKGRPQFVNWCYEERGNDITKVPYTPGTRRRASSTDLLTWRTFEEALGGLDRYDGIGFVFCSADPYVGVDLDGCVDPETGEVEAWAAQIVAELGSYTELSPSGKGVHIIARGELPEGRRRKGRVEMYDQDRFFTMTGRVLEGGR